MLVPDWPTVEHGVLSSADCTEQYRVGLRVNTVANDDAGCVAPLPAAWNFADAANALMALPTVVVGLTVYAVIAIWGFFLDSVIEFCEWAVENPDKDKIWLHWSS